MGARDSTAGDDAVRVPPLTAPALALLGTIIGMVVFLGGLSAGVAATWMIFGMAGGMAALAVIGVATGAAMVRFFAVVLGREEPPPAATVRRGAGGDRPVNGEAPPMQRFTTPFANGPVR